MSRGRGGQRYAWRLDGRSFNRTPFADFPRDSPARAVPIPRNPWPNPWPMLAAVAIAALSVAALIFAATGGPR